MTLVLLNPSMRNCVPELLMDITWLQIQHFLEEQIAFKVVYVLLLKMELDCHKMKGNEIN